MMLKPIFILGFLLNFLAPPAEGVCCDYGCLESEPKQFYLICLKWGCLDGTAATPYCGNGPCNIFGCNCDNGCKSGKYKGFVWDREAPVEREAAPGLDEYKAFMAIDTNGDGVIDMEEASAKVGPSNLQRTLESDLNGDGKISPNEFDEDISEVTMRMI